mgnify:FL=1
MMPLDQIMRISIDTSNWSRALSCLLVAGYAYYIEDKAVMPDELFDEACKALKAHWKSFYHPHKRLMKQADLSAGTLYHLKATDYPTIVRLAAITYIKDFNL